MFMYVCMYVCMYVQQALKGDVVEVVYEAVAVKVSDIVQNNKAAQSDAVVIRDGFSGDVIPTYIHIHTYPTHTYRFKHTYIHTYILIHTYIHTYIYMQSTSQSIQS